MGDEINKEYGGDSQNTLNLKSLITSALAKETLYESFKDTLNNICTGSRYKGDPDVNSLAFVFFLTQRFAEAAKEAGKKVDDFARFGQRYINEVYGEWIEQRGGWVSISHIGAKSP